MDTVTIDNRFTVGSQPGSEELREFAKSGFKTVVNLRTADEQDVVLTPREEGRQVQQLGMDYAWLPVPRHQRLCMEGVCELRSRIGKFPAPIYVHCRWGKRASALIWTIVAQERRLSGDEALMLADRMGLTRTHHYTWRTQLRENVRELLDGAKPDSANP